MESKSHGVLREGASGEVVVGACARKSGTVAEIHAGKTGHVTNTVVKPNGERFKTLARNVVVPAGGA